SDACSSDLVDLDVVEGVRIHVQGLPHGDQGLGVVAVVVAGDALAGEPLGLSVVARDRGHGHPRRQGGEQLGGPEHHPASEPDLLVEGERSAPDVGPTLGRETFDVVTQPSDMDMPDRESLTVDRYESGCPLEAVEGPAKGALDSISVSPLTELHVAQCDNESVITFGRRTGGRISSVDDCEELIHCNA